MNLHVKGALKANLRPVIFRRKLIQPMFAKRGHMLSGGSKYKETEHVRHSQNIHYTLKIFLSYQKL